MLAGLLRDVLHTAVDGGQRAQLGLLSGSLPELGQDISPLTLDVMPLSAAVLRVRIGAPGRWEVPQALFANRDAPGADLFFLHLLSTITAHQCAVWRGQSANATVSASPRMCSLQRSA